MNWNTIVIVLGLMPAVVTLDYFSFNQTVPYGQKNGARNSCPQKCHCSLEPVTGSKLRSDNQGSLVNAVDCESIDKSSMRSLMFTVPENVQYLAVRHSTMTQLSDVCCFNQLIQLDVSFNQLQTILTYVPFEKLKVLNLQNNNLRVLRKDEFSSFSQLEVLNLDNNQIVTIHPETFRLLQLKELYLGHNQLMYLDERTFRFTPLLQLLDIKANRLKKLHNRNLYFSKNLKTIDFSYNHLAVIDEEAFVAPLLQLQKVDLSYNNLTSIPNNALRVLPDLQRLVFDGNPVEILTLQNLNLTEFHLSHAKRLKMILAGSFKNLPHLSRLILENNIDLGYISNDSFQQTGHLKELHLAKNALKYIPRSIVQQTDQIVLDGNPLNCACMKDSNNLIDFTKLTCTNVGSECKPSLIPHSNKSINVAVGEPGSLFCVSIPLLNKNTVPVWTIPNGTRLTEPHGDDRITYSFEQLKFKFFLSPDRGRYRCTLGDYSDTRIVDVNVVTPAVHIFPLEVGSEYVVLRWNQSLSSPNHNPHFRFILIYVPVVDLNNAVNSSSEYKLRYLADDSLLWNTYSVYRLQPRTNYSFCLAFQYQNSTLYEFCTFVQTEKAYFGMGVTLNYSFIAILVITLGLIFAICTARCVHKRFHIWQEEKFRSRLAESLSGQSFLSSNAGSLNSETYENFQMMTARSFDLDHHNGLGKAPPVRSQYNNLHKSQYTIANQCDQPSTSRGFVGETALSDLAL